MKLNFKSTITQNENEKIIDFTSHVKISKDNEFKVFEFEDPQSKLMNRIEISDRDVNIFSGPASINLSLDEDVKINYTTPQGDLLLVSNMSHLIDSEHHIEFKYTLKHNDSEIGLYFIELKIIE